MPTRSEAKELVRGIQRVQYLVALGASRGMPQGAYHTIASLPMLLHAFYELRNRRRAEAAGADQQSIRKVEREIGMAPFLRSICRKLTRHEFKFSPARQKKIPKKRGDTRTIGIQVLENAVVLRAMLNFITPMLELHFHDSSFGSRPRRGVSDAIARLCHFLSNTPGSIYVIVRDVEDCFGSINRTRLMQLLHDARIDPEVMGLITEHLAAGEITPDGQLVHPTVGVTQGSAISGILANLVLNELDWRMEQHLQPGRDLYLRYMDDILIASVGPVRRARALEHHIEEILNCDLGLRLAPDKGGEGPAEQWINYLGLQVRRERSRGKAISRISPDKAREIRKAIETDIRAIPPREGQAESLRKTLNAAICHHMSPYKYTSVREPMARIDEHIRRLVLRWLERRHRRWGRDKIQKTYFTADETLLAGKPIFRCVDIAARKPRNRNRDLPWVTPAPMPPLCAPNRSLCASSPDKRPIRGRDSAVDGAGPEKHNVFRASAEFLAPFNGSPV